MGPDDVKAKVDIHVNLEEALQKALTSETARHLRKSGAELLRAVRCSLDGAIHILEPGETERKRKEAEKKSEEEPAPKTG